MTTAPTLKSIQASFASALYKETGIPVEVTFIGADRFSIAVEPSRFLGQVKDFMAKYITTAQFDSEGVWIEDGEDYAVAYYRS
jgi:hypothetical protein